MAHFFKAKEVALAAVEVEKQGKLIYKRLAMWAEDPEAKKFFEFFAGEETRHEALFQALADRLGELELPAWSSQEEYADYLKTLVETHDIFLWNMSEQLLTQAPGDQEAVKLAMSFEKNSILFFLEMKDLVPDGEKKFVQECVEEERRHLRQLAGMLRK